MGVESLIAQGSYTSDGTAKIIELPKAADYFVVTNRSTWGANPDAVVKSFYYTGFGAGQASNVHESGAGALTATTTATGGAGFTPIDLSIQEPGALVATGTAITAASPAVVSDANNPAVGDIVRVYNTTGMLQIAGMDFSVTAISAGVSYTLGYLDASGFAAAGTNADYRIIPQRYYTPTRRWITGITAANPAVITVSVAHNYLVGDKIRINVPAAFGMTQMNNKLVTITAVTASTITTDIDSSAFTAFAFPTSATAAAGVTFASITPVGEVATKLTSPIKNGAYYAMELGTAVCGANTNVMDWMAFSRDYTV